jgi:hypothetical protein
MKLDVTTRLQKTFFILGVLNSAISLLLVIVGIYFYKYVRTLFSYSKSPEEFAVNMSIAAIEVVILTIIVVSTCNTVTCFVYYIKTLSVKFRLGLLSLFVISCSGVTILIFMVIAGYILYFRFIS